MADYGVLMAICKVLGNNKEIIAKGVGENIYLHHPKIGDFPMIILEIEEIWTSIYFGNNTPCARLKLKASTFSENVSGKESIVIAEEIRKSVDGKMIKLHNGKQVILKLENSVIDLPLNGNKHRGVQQYYQAIIRG
jgi:hypothetical protein